MVFGSGFPVPTVLNPIYGLWVRFPCPNCVESYGLWVRFPCPTVESHIWSLGPVSIPYMVFGFGFNPIYGLWIRFPLGFPCPNCVKSHIWSVSIPYMVFGSGFPVPTVLNLWSLGPVSLSYCVESHIWSLGPVSLSHCVESHIWSLGLVSLSQLC